jgi:hypothetical protein
MPAYGTLSLLEGVRLVLAGAGVIASLWAVTHARDGSMAFARPIRERMVWRRRAQMVGYLVIFLVLGAQTVSAALVPDPAVITSAGIAVSYAMIAVLLILLLMTLMFSIGWAEVEEIVRDTPLVPTQDEHLAEVSVDGRHFAHAAYGQLSIATGSIELMQEMNDLPPAARSELEQAMAAVLATEEQVKELHKLAISLSPGNSDQPAQNTAEVVLKAMRGGR